MSYILDGMVSMLEHGIATPEMDFPELQSVCDEPDLHEFDDLSEMVALWEAAKASFSSRGGQTSLSGRC